MREVGRSCAIGEFDHRLHAVSNAFDAGAAVFAILQIKLGAADHSTGIRQVVWRVKNPQPMQLVAVFRLVQDVIRRARRSPEP